MHSDFVMVLAAIAGTVGFSIIFSVKPQRLFFATLGGVIACIGYLATDVYGVFISNMVGAFAATIYSELIARVQRAPIVTFVTPSIIVLVPGGSLYYTMANILNKDYDTAYLYGLKTLDSCLGIAAGILVASLIMNIILNMIKNAKRKREDRQKNI